MGCLMPLQPADTTEKGQQESEQAEIDDDLKRARPPAGRHRCH